jgi:hypothetical protein
MAEEDQFLLHYGYYDGSASHVFPYVFSSRDRDLAESILSAFQPDMEWEWVLAQQGPVIETKKGATDEPV